MAKPIPEMPSSVFVALVGRPNVGKSSLTNYLVGEKVAIVTKKPQTTRSRITGVITKGPVQYVLMDTPGIHAARNKLDARMTQTAAASLKDVDVTMMLFEPAGEFTDAELTMVKALQKGGPAIAVINKVDLLDSFAALEARKKQLEEFGCFDHIVTISAKDGTGCDELFAMLKPYGNEGPAERTAKGACLPLELPARGSLLLFTCTARESEALPLPPTYLSLAAPAFALADEDAAHLTKTYRATLQITATELQTATPLLTLPGQEMAELTVNGQPAGVSFWPPHKFPLAGLLTPGENTLTLTLTGSPANRYGKHPVPYGLER